MDENLTRAVSLNSGWRLARSEASLFESPADVDWSAATPNAAVPGTVASTLGEQDAADYDADDWWYECQFTHTEAADFCELHFDGLASIASVWLNGELILDADNMFRSWQVDVSGKLLEQNTLSIVFRSIGALLGQRRPRPRWKTNLVKPQQLRWIRTTLLGRIPGWTPALAPVGPWREVRLVCSAGCRLTDFRVVPKISDNKARITVTGELELGDRARITEINFDVAGTSLALPLTITDGTARFAAEVEPGELATWSPESPVLHDYALSHGSGEQGTELTSGVLGFRDLELDRTDGQLQFRLHGRDVFCRGACWTTNDIVSLQGDEGRLRDTLEQFKSAGGNTIRVGGTMVYESELFYDLCDELGIMVWQDFMFANMDYPSDDSGFSDNVRAEIEEQTRRLGAHPSVVAFCGNSEVEQQAAMFGATEEQWRSPLFYELIPEIVEKNCPGMPYFPSSPTEGALPFHNTSGPSHYFGVGAYRQPLASVATAEVKFTSECLAFSNVPSDRAMINQFGTAAPAVHHPDWKSGVPRDSAAGWDFEDIRDHYIKELYGLDPVALRYADKERYIAISQVVTGEVMQTVFDSWRRANDPCSGALIWQLRDIMPGAGWGIFDVNGQRKPVWYFLQRCWSPMHFALLDRGLDGLDVRLQNESDAAVHAHLNVQLLQHSSTTLVTKECELALAAGGTETVKLDQLIGRFYDITYRYQFGPPKHDVVVATLVDDDGQQVATRCFFPGSHDIRVLDQADISVDCEDQDGSIKIRLQSDKFLQHVKLFSRTHDFSDNHFHLAPDMPKIVTASPIVEDTKKFRGVLSALNLGSPVSFSA